MRPRSSTRRRLRSTREGRLWVASSGATTHRRDGVYLVRRSGARPVRIVSGLTAPLGLVWNGGTLYVASLGAVHAYSGFDGTHFTQSRVILSGPVAAWREQQPRSRDAAAGS